MGLSTDPAKAESGAKQLQKSQEDFKQSLAGNRPHIPLTAFGLGLQGHGARLLDLASRGHDVREAHANRLIQAARDASSLIQRVQSADINNSLALKAGLR